MLFGPTPFFGYDIQALITDIKSKVNNLEFPREISNESKDLIKRLLKTNPKERIDWHDFFNHPLFEKFLGKSTFNDLYAKLGQVLIEPEAENVESEF